MYASIHALTYFLQIKLLLYPPSEPAACTDGEPPDLHEKLMKSTYLLHIYWLKMIKTFEIRHSINAQCELCYVSPALKCFACNHMFQQ